MPARIRGSSGSRVSRSLQWLLLGLLVLLLGLWRRYGLAAHGPSATGDESLSVYKDPDDGTIRIFC
jgi:hypothetical protein